MGYRLTTLKDHLCTDHIMSEQKYQKVHKYFTFNPQILFTKFNEALQATILVEGHGGWNEAIWEYFGLTPHLVTIPCNPTRLEIGFTNSAFL